jgi:hypothetical protein
MKTLFLLVEQSGSAPSRQARFNPKSFSRMPTSLIASRTRPASAVFAIAFLR